MLARYRVNLVVDNGGLAGAPVIVEDNPLFRSLFGSIEYQSENDVLVTDFSRIRAGSLLQAHGGFLMLHLRDLLADPLVWEKLRRFLRSGRLQIEEPGMSFAPIAAVSLVPEAVDVEVKIVLIGSRDQYYELQEDDAGIRAPFPRQGGFRRQLFWPAPTPAAPRRFSSPMPAATTACRISRRRRWRACSRKSHREADDQSRESAIFARTEALVMESAAIAVRAGRAW